MLKKNRFVSKFSISIIGIFILIPIILITLKYTVWGYSYKKILPKTSYDVSIQMDADSYGDALYIKTYVPMSDSRQNIYNLVKLDIYKSKTSSNIIAIAYLSNKMEPDTLLKNAQTLQNNYRFYYDLTKLLKLKTTAPSFNKQKILTDDFAPINYLNAIEMHNKRASDL
jgi:hypothetical protein